MRDYKSDSDLEIWASQFWTSETESHSTKDTDLTFVHKMVSVKTLIAFVVVIFALIAVSAANKQREWKCLGQTVGKSSAEEDAMKKCKEEFKEKFEQSKSESGSDSTDKKGMWRCFTSCKHRKTGVLNSENKLDLDVLGAWVDKIMPEAAREGIKTDAKACADAITEPLSDDDLCKNHSGYQTCLMKAFMKNCKKDGEQNEES